MSNTYGHWSTAFDFDVRDFLAFTYEITFRDGKKYIGVKKFWKNLKVPPNELSARSRKKVVESDWKTYCSSSNDVEHLLHNENYPKSMIITGVYRTYGQACYREAYNQFINHAIGGTQYLNKQIDVQSNPNCFVDDFYDKKDFTLSSNDVRMKIVRLSDIDTVNNIDVKFKPVLIKPDLSATVVENKKIKKIKNVMHFCVERQLNPVTFNRLLCGDIDSYDGLSLPVARKLSGVYLNENYLGKLIETCSMLNMTKKQLLSSGYEILSKDESRDDYKARLIAILTLKE